jgi:hypothetical protein
MNYWIVSLLFYPCQSLSEESGVLVPKEITALRDARDIAAGSKAERESFHSPSLLSCSCPLSRKLY